MILHVRLYGAGNPDGAPADWPAECREIHDDAPAPDGWLAMTVAEYDAYCAERQAAADAWLAQVAVARAGADAQARKLANRERAKQMLVENDAILVAVRALGMQLQNAVNELRQKNGIPARTPQQGMQDIAAIIDSGAAD